MDEYSMKRSSERLGPRKMPGLIQKDTAKGNSQYCSRLSCSSRVTSSANTNSTNTSSNGRGIVGSSSRTSSVLGKSKKSVFESPRKLPSQSESEASENGGIEDEQEGSDLVSPPGKIQRGLHAHSKSGDSINVGSSSVASGSRSSVSIGVKNPSSASIAGPSRYGLRNLKCSSLSDAIASGCSSTRNNHRTKDIAKNSSSAKESSSASRGKTTNGSPLERRNINSGYGISISDSRIPRNTPSARTRSSLNGNILTRLSMESLHESSGMSRQSSRRSVSINGNTPSSSNQLSTDLTSRRPISRTRPRNSNGNIVRPATPIELGTIQYSTNQESLQLYNIDGVAEVLLALERIEQDEELTDEQVILLETSLLLNGINFYDQHRDMRLDIDNMSYEELLALEERMGTVSTALPEDALSRCLTRSIFQSNNDRVRCCSDDKDDVKCCICQEEYVNGDTVGRLECKHRYHEGCIQQWLRQKNWCPICKASAEHPRRPSSSS